MPRRRIHLYLFLLDGFWSFDSLSKVLFILPSQYFFAIGFPHIFSLRRSLSNLDAEAKWSVDCAARGIRSSLSLRTEVCHLSTRMCVRLLGPCFQTGCREPFAKPSHPPEPLPDKSDGFLRNMKRLGCLRSQGGGPREPPKDDQSTHWLPTVPSQQFQALFDSLRLQQKGSRLRN